VQWYVPRLIQEALSLNLDHGTGYTDIRGFSSYTLGKFRDINLDQDTADSFHILSNSTFILPFYAIYKEKVKLFL
jgi:hypothetical protein